MQLEQQLGQHSDELAAVREELRQYMSRIEQADQQLGEKNSELSTVREQLESHASEREAFERQHQQVRQQLQQQIDEKSAELAAASEQLKNSITRQAACDFTRTKPSPQRQKPDTRNAEEPDDTNDKTTCSDTPLDTEKIVELAEMAKHLWRGRT
jgi:chromosome segregation ATPase